MLARLRRHHAPIAALMAVAVVAVGWIWNTRIAGGADAYGYVSQADLWLRGNLFIDQRFAAAPPWPFALWTFTPLGYRPDPHSYRLVPVYSVGLPLLMAAAKTLAGQCGLFAVAPLAGGVLVFATYAIGRRIGRPIVGLAAAWLVATSATTLYMTVQPMSDVPAAAAWAVAVALLLGRDIPQTSAACASASTSASSASCVLSGVAAAVAITIRPNLVPLAGVLAVWAACRDARSLWPLRPLPPLRSVLFALSASAGAAFIAIVNTRLYGSPLASGYGDLSDAYALANVMPNLRQYGWWLISSETPLAVAGFLCLAIPARRLWPTREACRALWLFSAYAASVWISYLFYVVWDAWWYLRFLLPAWPMMAIGLASLLAAIYASHSVVWKRAAIVLVAAIGVAGMVQAYRQSAFSMAAGEAKYVEAARVIETISRPDDVIVTWQHSGSIRYYAGRLTLRWDVLAPRWLDFAIAWLQARGHHVYLLLEEPELKPFRDRFTATSSIGRLDWLPMVSFRRGAVRLYDVAHTDRRELPVEQPELRGVRECLVQRPPPVLKETR